MKRNRKWLKSFLNLGAEQDKGECITEKEVRRQENTVLKALEILDREPGVVLADEVGMGKTFEAMGIMASYKENKPRAKILIITPGPDLNRHWIQAMKRFHENGFYPFKSTEYGEINRFAELPDIVEQYSIVFAPVTIFSSGRSRSEHEFLFNAYFRWASLHRNTRRAICKNFFNSVRAVQDVRQLKFLSRYSYWDLKDHFNRAFLRNRRTDKNSPLGYLGLHDLYQDGGTDTFKIKKNKSAIYHALDRARFHLLNKCLPIFDLLIVDEAHKLKNPWTLRSQAVSNILYHRYRKTLFLTATPFQLGVHELEQVFNIFSYAVKAPKELKEQVLEFFGYIKEYQQLYIDFEYDWKHLDQETAANFGELYNLDPRLLKHQEDPILRKLHSEVRQLKYLKRIKIEPGFRRWMIRSLKEDPHEYRNHKKHVLPTPRNGLIPFLIYEKMLLEIYRQHRSTYKATVEINMTSSFEAALGGKLLVKKDPVPEVEGYRKLLKTILEREIDTSGHPKIKDIVDVVIKAMQRDEKTLVFCERIETIKALRKKISNYWDKQMLTRWQKLFPGASSETIWGSYEDMSRTKGKQTNLQARFRKSQDVLYLALRENFIYTILDIPNSVLRSRKKILDEANRILTKTLSKPASANRLDYRLLKRCVEQAVYRYVNYNCPNIVNNLKTKNDNAWQAFNNVMDKEYPNLGLDLLVDEEEGDRTSGIRPTWKISYRVLKSVLSSNRKGIWFPFREKLNELDPEMRLSLVKGISSFLTRRGVTFLVDLLDQVKARGGDLTSSMAIRDTLEKWWQRPHNQWRTKIEEFIDYFLGLNHSRQLLILEEALKTGKLVSDTLATETRERIKEAFNTPFYPTVIVGNKVMQEGIDLHRNCRRLVHHDLVWNPAQLEQRVGRLDRIGCLFRREKESGNDLSFLEIYYPLINRAIDIRIYRVVKEREKWLNFLLGTPPDDFNRYDLSESPSIPLPSRLSKDLTVKLQPV
jgi:superfamily II DNA or RNA helicase